MFASFFESLPIILALIAIVISAKSFHLSRRKADKVRCLLSIIIALLLIIAQSSWYITSVILGKVEDTTFANHLWTVFNTLVMLILIMFPGPRVYKNGYH